MLSIDAWEEAGCDIFKPLSSLQRENCPRNAFLGLYGGEGKSAGYAKKALLHLKDNPHKLFSSKKLWAIVCEDKKWK